jgi:hypothetical protein
MALAEIQPQLDDTLFGRPVEKNTYKLLGLGGVLKAIGGARPLELDDTGFIRIGYRVVEVGARQSKTAGLVLRKHEVEAIEAELEPDE